MPPFKIFYAWQSDTSTKLNRNLIHEAAEEAIKALNADAAIEDAPAFELDHDTKDAPGSPIVAEEICKKIRECSLFLADLSFVARYARADGTTLRWTPNPNVLIELGYARHVKGIERIIGVMNVGTTPSATDPKGGPGELPFDLAHLRYPITYKLTDPKDEAKREEKKAELVSDLVAAIGTALKPVVEERKRQQQEDQERKRLLARTRIKERRHDFEKRLPNGGFRGFEVRGAQPIIAFSIIPLEQVDPPIDVVARSKDLFARLKPIAATGWDAATEPGAAWVWEQAKTQGPPIRDAVSEFSSDGSIFAATAVYYDAPPDANTRAGIDFVHVEREIFKVIDPYLRLLRTDLDINQDLAFCLTFLGGRNFILKPTPPRSAPSLRPLAENEIHCPPTIIPAGAYAKDTQEAAQLVREAFNHLWQFCGLPFDPHIQQPKPFP